MELETLQSVINKRAEKRLDKDLRDIAENIQGMKLISITDHPGIPMLSFKVKNSKGEEAEIEKDIYFLFKEDGHYLKLVKQYWLPRYQAEESKEFINSIDRLNAINKNDDI